MSVILKPRPHQQQCRSNIVECYNVERCFDIVASVDRALLSSRSACRPRCILPPGESRWVCRQDRQTDRWMDGRQTVILRFPLNAASVIMHRRRTVAELLRTIWDCLKGMSATQPNRLVDTIHARLWRGLGPEFTVFISSVFSLIFISLCKILRSRCSIARLCNDYTLDDHSLLASLFGKVIESSQPTRKWNKLSYRRETARRPLSVEISACRTNNANRCRVSLTSTFSNCQVIFNDMHLYMHRCSRLNYRTASMRYRACHQQTFMQPTVLMSTGP